MPKQSTLQHAMTSGQSMRKPTLREEVQASTKRIDLIGECIFRLDGPIFDPAQSAKSVAGGSCTEKRYLRMLQKMQ
jgi:hypothetical protein